MSDRFPQDSPPQPPHQPPQSPSGGAAAAQPQPQAPQIPPQILQLLQSGTLPGGMAPRAIPLGAALQAQQTINWQGPYPPPDFVEHYEKILPGVFDRMITMAEELQAAQISESKRVQDYTFSEAKRGHWLGFLAAIAAMACAVGASVLHEPWVAVAFISVPVMGVAKALVDATKKSSPSEILAAAATQPAAATPPQAAPSAS
jgi:uncharacterized membrane protein